MDIHAILDQIDEIIYISDIETDELLYLNRRGRDRFGTIPLDAKCYEFLQGQKDPCPFCTNALLKSSAGHRCTWVRHHPTVGNMLLHDSLIEYKGRLCRMEMAVDVNRYVSELNDAKLNLAAEKKLVSCIESLVMSADFDAAVEAVLKTIIEHYAADRAYVFEIDWDNDVTHNTYEVCREGVTPEKENLQDLPIAVVAGWIDVFQNDQKINIIEDVDALKDDPARRIEYDCLHPQGIRSLITVPVFIGGQLHGFLGIDNPTANVDAPELLTQITYIAANELQKRRLTEDLTEKSYHDPLTGFQNRLAYDEALSTLKGPAVGQGIGVGFVDMNGLKYLNDTLGHEHGNKAIKRTCSVMRECFDADVLYRVSGDEFIVLWPDVDYAVFSYVSRALDKRLTDTEGGIAAYGYTWGTAQDDLHALVLEAEQLMIAEKNQYYLEHAADEDKPRPAYLDSLLQEIRASTFITYLQPLYSIQAGQVYGAEALVRKIGPDGKIHVPVEFLHVLEQEHMVSTVDYSILEQVCELLVQRKDEWPELKINCNMSRQTLSEPNYLERIDEILARTGVDPAQLTFEVTEGSQNIKMDRLEATLDALRSRGITLAIDDMGTEASCLEMLYLPQIETVKLDRSLICKAEHSEREQTVISSMIDLCHKLDMFCVAEGIETEAQVELLKQMHCDRLQGYYIGKPMPPEEFFGRFCPKK